MAKRVDANQWQIVRALRQAGCAVADTHEIGRGFPDILVSRAGVNYLLEVKSPGGVLTDDERCWQAFWRGQVAIVTTPEEALRVVGVEVEA